MSKNSVIALDPTSKRFFRYNLQKNTFSYEKDIPEQEKDKIDEELKKLDMLQGLEITGWNLISEESKNYRRRAIWYYLLQAEYSQYPSFISSRELSSAFADITDIKLIIDISSYIYSHNYSQSDSEEDLAIEEKNSIQYNKERKAITIKISLMFSAIQTMKYMKEQVNKEYGIKLSPFKSSNKLVFKANNRKEYFTGNSPMLAFRYVRDSLRGMEFVMLKLTEIPKKNENVFPVFVNEDEKMPFINNYLMFYAPSENESESITPKLLKPRVFILNSQAPAKERKKLTEKLLKGQEATEKIYTGECDWPFRVKICGLEGILNIFTEGFRGNATNNGHDHPAYVILPQEKEKKKGKTEKRTDSLGERKSSLSVFRFKSRKLSKNMNSSSSFYTNFMNHGPSSGVTGELANEFKLPFIPYLLSFDVMLLYGEEVLKDCLIRTELYPFNFNARLMEWVKFPISYSNLPKETRIGINIYAMSKTGEDFLLGSVMKSIFNEIGEIRRGAFSLNLWPFYKVEQRIACMQEFWGTSSQYQLREPVWSGDSYNKDPGYAKIFIQFENFVTSSVTWSLKDENYYKTLYKSIYQSREKPLIIKGFINKRDTKKKICKIDKIITNRLTAHDSKEEEDIKLLKAKPQLDDLANLEKALMTDPLEVLSESQKTLLFLCRDHYKTIPSGLPLFLRSVDWTRPLQVTEALKLLENWSRIDAEDALALLNAEYADENLRLFACRKISQISDEDFVLYMPQLTQALSFEICHYSSLGELLIERALKSPHYVGHSLFWALRSQLYIKATAERFSLILEQFLMLCGGYRSQLMNELKFIGMISDLSTEVARKSGFQERETYLKAMLLESVTMIPDISTLPIDSSMEVSEPCIDQSKVMNSKKMPLWMTMKNSDFDSDNVEFIFKVGDDLRQDILTLQMIRVMDTIWLENGLDLRMNPYRVVVTGDQSGIIEVVSNSDTTADIQLKYGGPLGALKKTTLLDYLIDHNPSKDQFEKASDNFKRSCAGYCVASYILGIADRHNGNIMMTKTGHLFHIDFGHFLGNFKVKFGIQRERSNFVLTVEMVHAMGGIESDGKESPGFIKFKDYCSTAYNLTRIHGKRLINLFMLMTSAGMPELQNKKEIEYIREMLSLKLTETEAIQKFNLEIKKSLNNTFRRFDNLIHNFRRG